MGNWPKGTRMVMVPCTRCGKEKRITRSLSMRRKNHFCNQTCFRAHLREHGRMQGVADDSPRMCPVAPDAFLLLVNAEVDTHGGCPAFSRKAKIPTDVLVRFFNGGTKSMAKPYMVRLCKAIGVDPTHAIRLATHWTKR